MSDIQDMRPLPGPPTMYNMLLRDYFAAAAIGPVLGTPWFTHLSQKGSCEYAIELANECYAIADRLLEERKK